MGACHGLLGRVTRRSPADVTEGPPDTSTAGIEVMHMIRKGQMVTQEGTQGQTPAQQFYSLAA
jgi:hypothetical protein